MALSAAGCEAMMQALVPGFEPRTLASLEEVAAGVAWTGEADPQVRARVERAASIFPRRRELDVPEMPGVVSAVFKREVADVHRELFAAERDRYGDNVRIKVEQALNIGGDEYVDGLRAREEFRERMAAACEDIDLLMTPTVAFVAPTNDLDDLAIRDAVIRFTLPFNALGWPALALPCGVAEHGLPASIQLVSPRGDDALVLAAGRTLEAAR
jgi:aspartyl-tRNA(Asn)/glutamyl-tRNA(Gln) amidotransferase subunit A